LSVCFSLSKLNKGGIILCNIIVLFCTVLLPSLDNEKCSILPPNDQ